MQCLSDADEIDNGKGTLGVEEDKEVDREEAGDEGISPCLEQGDAGRERQAVSQDGGHVCWISWSFWLRHAAPGYGVP